MNKPTQKPDPKLLALAYLWEAPVPIELIELTDFQLLHDYATADGKDQTYSEAAGEVIAAGNETYYK